MVQPVFSYKLRYIVGFWLVEMAISTNPKPTIYRNLYENTDRGWVYSNTRVSDIGAIIQQHICYTIEGRLPFFFYKD